MSLQAFDIKTLQTTKVNLEKLFKKTLIIHKENRKEINTESIRKLSTVNSL